MIQLRQRTLYFDFGLIWGYVKFKTSIDINPIRIADIAISIKIGR